MLLILSDRGDVTVDMVLPKIESRGLPVVWWDPGDFPSGGRVTVTFQGDEPSFLLATEDRDLDLGDVTAVWVRRPNAPTAAVNMTDPTQRAHVERVSRFFMAGLWDLLTVPWFPARPPAVDRAHNKLVHLDRAVRLGFTIPETVMTNDPAALVPAYARSDGHLIAKLFDSHRFLLDGQDHRVHTTAVTRRQLTSRHRVQHEPVILQPYVPKAVELRVTVVGDRVFAVEIDARNARAAHDDRRHHDDTRVRYAVHTLPADVERRCVDLVVDLGLAYGAIDLILRPDGEYVFLEIDPNGEWGWLETNTGLPISDAVADWLATAARNAGQSRDAEQGRGAEAGDEVPDRS
ncbi:ATP-dependent carboxylate-amine ligase [Microtetraspora sp. AC03309]|uniref:MvdC/MvdD family ATP grasp protein n=1 Tax=Microtetraspora sp. AC03309 TaxID=2779376 RepID=UPI001E4CD515|nr:ATP-dependent carboxylate-amine ligase [Microtetraspora sp. AC03309]MCC5574939.1 ATP-dependent carboxylate-amine ligase [Microtetraspora sp. AC03309]